MKRLLLPLAAAALAILAAAVVLNLFTVPPRHAGPTDLAASCPFRVVDRFGNGYGDERWEVSFSIVEGREPDIRVHRDAGLQSPDGAATCRLDILRPPLPPVDGIDWRIGHTVARLDDLRGKTVRVSTFLRAEPALRLSTAALYGYDGVQVPGVPVRELGPDWQEFAFTVTVDDAAPVFETWLRLVLSGAISGPGSIWFGDTRLTIDPA